MYKTQILAVVALVAVLGLIGSVALPLVDTANAAEQCKSESDNKDKNPEANGCGWAGNNPHHDDEEEYDP